MTSWHPALIHYPIALVAVAALFQLLALIWPERRFTVSALIALGAGGLVAVAAAVTGTAQEEAVRELSGIAETLERHEDLGTLSAVLMNALALGGLYLYLKEKLPAPLFLVLLVRLSGLLILTGHWGGLLVFQYGAGLQTPVALPGIIP